MNVFILLTSTSVATSGACSSVLVTAQVKRADFLELGRVHLPATKLIGGMKCLTYIERLKGLSMFSLERCQLKVDIIKIYKMLKGNDKIGISLFKLRSLTRTHGHGLKLKESRSRPKEV